MWTSIENLIQASFVFDYGDENDDIDDLVESIKMRFNKFLQAEYKGTIFDWAKETFFKVNFISVRETTDRNSWNNKTVEIVVFLFSMVENFQNHFTSKLQGTEN